MILPSPVLREKIEQKIKEALSPIHLCVRDETAKHAGHRGAVLGKRHFTLHAVSNRFEGTPRLNRNRMIFEILKEEMESEIHSLSIRAQTPSEWESEQGGQETPST